MLQENTLTPYNDNTEPSIYVNIFPMNNRHYSKAPVIEAVIDIQVDFPSNLPIAHLAELADHLKDKFPIRTKMTSIQMRLDAEVKDGVSNKLSSTQDEFGLRLSDNINSRILQLRKIGFAYSHLPQYSNWDSFSKEARGYWELFVKHCQPETVTRCAVRYINRIDIPEALIEIEDYLNIYPRVPTAQVITGMQMQLQIPQQDIGSMAVINEAIVDPAIPKGFSVIVDIDLFKFLSIVPTSEDVWITLDQLRIRKNELFEAFITDNTREIIQ